MSLHILISVFLMFSCFFKFRLPLYLIMMNMISQDLKINWFDCGGQRSKFL